MGGRNGVARRVALLAAGAAILGGPFASAASAQSILAAGGAAPIVVVPEHVPRFYANLNLLLMSRGQADPQPIMTVDDDASPETVTMDATDYHFGWSFGLAGRAGFQVDDTLAVEAGAFWIRPLEATVEMDGNGLEYIIETNPEFAQPHVGPLGATLDAAVGHATTRLHGFEANVATALDHGFTVYGGATYVRLRDEIGIEAQLVLYDDVLFTWTADNRMVGPQLGLRFDHEAARATFGFDIRAAYLFNSVLATFTAGLADATDEAKTHTVMLAAGINTGFRLSHTTVLTLGYQIMSFSNVATGFSQIPGTVPVFFPDVDLTAAFGRLVVHGLTAGVTLTY